MSLQKTVFEFVWNRKQDRISRKTAIKNIAKGGLGIPKIRQYINALKLIWVRKLKTSNHKWKSILKVCYPKVLLLGQLGSSFNVKDCHLNKFGLMYFRHIENSVEKSMLRNRRSLLQSLFSAMTIFKLKIEIFFYKNWIDSGV